MTSGQQLTDNHFGNFQDATKTGTKFNDLDGDGTKDGGEPGLENWVIRAYEDDGDGALAGGETIHDSDTTDSNGDYSLSLDPGDYVVCEVAQTGWTQSAPANTNCAAGDADLADGGHAELGVTSGQQLTDNHFGNFQDATKTGTKFNDLDGDGTKDGGEPGLENWVIRAYEDDGDGALAGGETIHDSDTTDSNGDYSLSLDPGDYVVCEVAQTGWTQSAPANTNCAAGDADLADGGHAELGVTSGQQLTDNHFGNYEPGTVVIEKDTVPNGPTDFTYTDDIDDCELGPLDDDSDPTNPNTDSCANVAPGSYEVSEDDPTPGHDLTALTCTDSDENGTESSADPGTRTATIELDPGETVTCHFENTERGKIELIKNITPDADPGRFDLLIKQGQTTIDSLDNAGDGASTGENLVPAGAYQVSEEGGDQPVTNLADYQKSIRCIDTANGNEVVLDQPADDADASVQVDIADDIVCTITNQRETPPGGGQAGATGGGVAGAVGGGGSGGGAAGEAVGADDGGTLPFTGLQLPLLVLTAISLLGLGYLTWRRSVGR